MLAIQNSRPLSRSLRVSLMTAASAMAVFAGPAAWANDYCPDRPGLDTPPCTISRGHLSAEVSLADSTRKSDAATTTDTLLIGSTGLRYGIGDTTEFRLAWNPYGRVKQRDRASGALSVASGSGDVTLGIKQNILDPGGQHLSIALLPSVTLPSGGEAIGSGTWSTGLQVPVSFAAGRGFSLLLTPEIDAEANADGSGRHMAFGTAGGIGYSPVPHLSIALEASVMHDDDPQGHTTTALAGLSAGLMLGRNFQFDLGTELGLNRQSPDHRLYLGVSRRF